FSAAHRDAAGLALDLTGLVVGALTIGFVGARRLVAPVATITVLFAPLICSLVFARPTQWVFFLVSTLLAYGFSFVFAEGLRRQFVGAIYLRVALQKANADLSGAMAQIKSDYQLRERFLRGVSHDLRQPVAALGFFLKRLERDFDAETVRQSLRCLDATNAVMDSLVQISLLSQAQQPAKRERVALETLFDQMRVEFAWRAERDGVAFRTRGAHHAVIADAKYLERVVRNLVSNALRLTDRGGVLLAARRRDRTVEILVVDTGPGIEHAFHDAVFDEFFQTDAVDAKSSGTLGVGLYIVRELTKKMDGRVRLRSRPGKGSTFIVSLPAAELR
ncbi:MAG: HAMP domain-containing sensor histidine kinase, partial [Pseudomonadota bacterium]